MKNIHPTIDRNFAMDLVRVTEAAAIASAQHMGKGDKELVDQAAVDAMRFTLGSLSMDGIVVIGEGEKDEAPMLFNGELIGDKTGPKMDIAVDPIDGTTLLSKGLPGAIAVIALSERGTMNCPRDVMYVNKIAVGKEAKGHVDVNASVSTNLKNISKAKKKRVEELTVVVLDRPRHDELLEDIRTAGARIKLISDGDVAAGIHAAMANSGVDALMGIGGTPEGVIVAAAIRCIGGEIQCKAWPRDDEERNRALAGGADLDKVYTTEDLVSGKEVFFAATGASSGDLLRGVNFLAEGAQTHSLSMRSRSATLRWIDTVHDFTRLDKTRYRG